MECLLRDFYKELRLEINGEVLCKELERRSLVTHDDTELVIAKARLSKMEGNDELYGIICRKIMKNQLEDLLQSMASCGNYALAQKITNKHKDFLPESFFLEDHGTSSEPGISSGTTIMNLFVRGHHNNLTFGQIPQNIETDESNDSDIYEIEDQVGSND